MCKNTVMKLLFVIVYVPDEYNIQENCNKAFLENGENFKSIPDCYKNRKMCN